MSYEICPQGYHFPLGTMNIFKIKRRFPTTDELNDAEETHIDSIIRDEKIKHFKAYEYNIGHGEGHSILFHVFATQSFPTDPAEIHKEPITSCNEWYEATFIREKYYRYR